MNNSEIDLLNDPALVHVLVCYTVLDVIAPVIVRACVRTEAKGFSPVFFFVKPVRAVRCN